MTAQLLADVSGLGLVENTALDTGKDAWSTSAGECFGYIRARRAADSTALIGADASHAWVSVWCGEDPGWVEFDPINNLVVTDQHVVVTYGRGFSDLTPLRGVILGGGKHSLPVAVSVLPPAGAPCDRAFEARAGLWADAERRLVGRIAVLCLFLFAAATARADDAGQCQANGGTYLTGTVTQPPVFAPAHAHPHGVELSHTHLKLLADQDGQNYDVAIDNVFASGYDAAGAGESVPAPLSTIRAGDRLDLCGRLYSHGGVGIDWVHTDCGDTPSSAKPDGWLKVVAADGTPGPNLEASREYCRLWR